ncbi:MAG: metallophosphoesterase family protein [Phenylobacterium sp.]|uniref:metallophosphoesterase family protein n=1 Tax=Phenylobacterium sp. TaxID=1871053 RepID=UPI00391DE0B3
MFDKLFLRKKAHRRPPPTTGGRLVYAVGDIHGRLDLLNPLIETIVADAVSLRPQRKPLLVFLGDYVDRGPASAGVVERILKLSYKPAFEVRTLKGNHEEALLQFLEDPEFGQTWATHGGLATLAAYGVQAPAGRLDADGWRRASEAFGAALPASHRAFYKSLELTVEAGDYLFVHAGVRPGVPLNAQAERDLLWIRGEFLDAAGPFDKVVVHGHTPMEEPQILDHRLGLDTGAYATGVLTAVRLYGEERKILQARDSRAAAAAA